MAEVVLWKAKDLGYLAVTADAALARGELRPRAAEFKAGRLGKIEIPPRRGQRPRRVKVFMRRVSTCRKKST